MTSTDCRQPGVWLELGEDSRRSTEQADVGRQSPSTESRTGLSVIKSPGRVEGKEQVLDHEEIMQGVTESWAERSSRDVVCNGFRMSPEDHHTSEVFKTLLDKRVESHITCPQVPILSLAFLSRPTPSLSQGHTHAG